MQTGEILPAPTVEERVEVSKNHLRKSVEWKGPIVGINEMRRHYSNYLKGLPNIKDYRIRLTTLKSLEAIFSLLDEINKTYENFQPEKRKLNMDELAYSCG